MPGAGDIPEEGPVAGHEAASRCQHGQSRPGIRHNGAVDHAEAALLAEYPDLELGHDLAPTTAIWPTDRFRLRHGTVTALDRILAATLSRTTRLPPDARLLTASRDLGLVVAAAGGSLIVLGETRWRLAVPGADSAAILGSGQLVVTARVTAPGRTSASANRVLLLDPAAREVVDEVQLALNNAGISVIVHPRDGSVLLDAGMGQDGSQLFAARIASQRLSVSPVLENVVACGFDPAGDRLLLVPHVSYGPEASVVAWPSLTRVAAITPGRNGLADDPFYFYGCFLDQDEVLLTTVHSDGLRPVICSGDLAPRALVTLPGYGPDSGLELVSVLGTASGTFAAGLEGHDTMLATVWQLARLPGC
jgi:hypothetical protein